MFKVEYADIDVLRARIREMVGHKVAVSVAHGPGELAEVIDLKEVPLLRVEDFAPHEEGKPDNGFVIALANGKMRMDGEEFDFFQEDEIGRLRIQGRNSIVWLEDEDVQ